ncbi:uncharacterized protein LOC117108138 [Anneissia japonica]|uniref:uncharacterized protein LOC117108138 n=1 Tax=Anneissia japonica TaxID=1529436 RepID=UPI0014256283|nr:uncharacterized protein LOC117108138 [Anneissia japonica]
MQDNCEKYGSLILYFNGIGYKLTELENACIIFHLSQSDPNAFENLWKRQESNVLIKDLAKILVPEEYQQVFLDEWMTCIDPDEPATSELNEEVSEEEDLETEPTPAKFKEELDVDVKHDVGSDHGFRPSYSTSTALINATEQWYSCIDEDVVGKMLEELSEDSDEEDKTQLVKTEKVQEISEELSEDCDMGHTKQLLNTDCGVTDDAFRQLLLVISNWYDKYGYISMLKVLYRDHLEKIPFLSHASRTLDIMNLLIACGDLDSTDISLFFDTIKATKTFGLKNKIKPQIPSCPNVRDVKITKFTSHRQKIIKLGMALTNDDITVINELYNKTVKKYADSWSLIMDLEDRMIICEGKMEAFIDNLKESGLLRAVNSLTEGYYQC